MSQKITKLTTYTFIYNAPIIVLGDIYVLIHLLITILWVYFYFVFTNEETKKQKG